MFTVRTTKSGYSGIAKFHVFNGPRRVSVHAYGTRESAQAHADELNIGALVKDHDVDPRPYQEKLAEARAAFERSRADDEGRCSGCGNFFNGRRGLRSHQGAKHAAMACLPVPAS